MRTSASAAGCEERTGSSLLKSFNRPEIYLRRRHLRPGACEMGQVVEEGLTCGAQRKDAVSSVSAALSGEGRGNICISLGTYRCS